MQRSTLAGARATDGQVTILAFGDSLTEGFYNHGRSWHPYATYLGKLLQSAGLAAEVDESGRSGARVVGDLNHRLKVELQSKEHRGKRYDWVLILGGINDIASGTDAQSVMRGLREMYSHCHAHGARVLAMTLMETSYSRTPTFQAQEAHRQLVNKMLREYAGMATSTAAVGLSGTGTTAANGLTSASVGDSIAHAGSAGVAAGGVINQAVPEVLLLDLERELPYFALGQEERARLWDDGLHLTPEGYDRMAELIWGVLRGQLQQQQAAAHHP